MKNKIKITNKNPNVKLVKSGVLFFVMSCFIFFLITGFMIGEAVKTQRLSRQNVNLNKELGLAKENIIESSDSIYKQSSELGYTIKNSNDKYFVEKNIDSKYTYLFK